MFSALRYSLGGSLANMLAQLSYYTNGYFSIEYHRNFIELYLSETAP